MAHEGEERKKKNLSKQQRRQQVVQSCVTIEFKTIHKASLPCHRARLPRTIDFSRFFLFSLCLLLSQSPAWNPVKERRVASLNVNSVEKWKIQKSYLVSKYFTSPPCGLLFSHSFRFSYPFIHLVFCFSFFFSVLVRSLVWFMNILMGKPGYFHCFSGEKKTQHSAESKWLA